MKALLLHDIVIDGVVAGALTAGGHEVVRCSPTGSRQFPCVGFDGRCPLDGTVDVAVVVHDRPSDDFGAGEIGAICALRDGIPVVVAGSGAPSPLREVATVVASGVSDIVGACERAIAAREARLGRAAGGEVTIAGGQVRATLAAGASSVDVARAHAALAEAVPTAHTIDVAVAPD